MTGSELHASRRYRFGPLPARGVLGDLRGGQVVILGLAVLGALGLVRRGGGMMSLVVALVLLAAGSVAAFAAPRGRGIDEWMPVLAQFAYRHARGRRGWRSPTPTAGASDPDLVLPPELADVELLEVPFRGSTVGVVKGVLEGSYTIALAVQANGIGLLESREQEHAGARWGTALASLAAESSPVARVSWVERTLPSDGDALGRYLAEEHDPDVEHDAPAMRSYLALLDDPGIVGKDHELLLAMQITRSSARAEIREEGGDDEGACVVLLRELETWAQSLVAAQLTVRGVLTPRMLARALRTHYDPFARATLARSEARAGERDGGISVSQAAPLATEESWESYRADGAVHTTYWVSAWPRMDVGMQWLAPLLLSGDVVRSTAVVIDVLAPSTAQRKVEHERTSEIAAATRQRRGGAMVTARQRRRAEATAAREDELSHGHALARHAGFVTVSSRSPEEHRRSCLQVETLAQRAGLEVRVMYGEQPAALTFTTPLCRGLR